MRLRIGTSGYDFDEWEGEFYPSGWARDDRLMHYAREFSTVEINNTFYRNPRSSVVASWAEQVGDDFVFVIKASKRITHRDPLTDTDTLGYLWRAVRHLGPSLGPILFQTSPYFRRDDARLAGFLDRLPDGISAVFELRHPSWATEEVFELLRRANAAWCVSDQPRRPPPRVVATASFGYVRLHRPAYEDAELDDWVSRLRGLGVDEVFVMFKHDTGGAGPALARRFGTRWSEPA